MISYFTINAREPTYQSVLLRINRKLL